MTAFRYKHLCTNNPELIEDAVRADFPMYFSDGTMFYLPQSSFVTFDEATYRLSFVYHRVDSSGYEGKVLVNYDIGVCKVEPVHVFSSFPLSDIFIAVFLVLLFIIGISLGVRGHG
jgi:hypothetical protein